MPLGFICRISLIGLISLISFGDVGIIGLVGLLALSACQLIGFICLVTIHTCQLIGFISLGINSLISLLALSTCWLIGLGGFAICDLAAAIIAATATLSAPAHKKATHTVVVAKSSATKIINEAIYTYCAASLLHVHWFVREKMWWWLDLARKKMWWWIASFGYSYHGDMLQYAKQLFSLGFLQMT